MNKLTLYPYQKAAVKFHLKRRYSINGYEMGLGKTCIAVTMSKFLKKKRGYKTLVVCPAFLITTWINEYVKFSTMKYGEDYKVVSYTSLAKFEELFKWADFIICDEAHYLKNPQAKRTKLFFEFMKEYRPSFWLGLTGTPVKNRVGEIYPLLEICALNDTSNGLNITKWFPNHYKFQKHFSYEYFNGFGTVFRGLKNAEFLKKFLKGKYIRKTAKQVLDLPPLDRIDHNVEVTEDYGKELLELFEKYEGKLEGHLTTAKLNHAIYKVPGTIELLGKLEGPVVIFTEYLEPAGVLYRECIASGYKSYLITGETPPGRRAEIVNNFQLGIIKVLVATTGALSVGVTLTAANTLIFNDLPWVPGDILQAEKRIHRIGQNDHCKVYRVIYGEADKVIVNTLTKKANDIKELGV